MLKTKQAVRAYSLVGRAPASWEEAEVWAELHETDLGDTCQLPHHAGGKTRDQKRIPSYTASSRPTWDTWDPVLENKQYISIENADAGIRC